MIKSLKIVAGLLLCSALPVAAQEINLEGSVVEAFFGYIVSDEKVSDSLPESALGAWGDQVVYASENPSASPVGGIAYIKTAGTTSGAILMNDIYIRCKTTDMCVPYELQDTAEKVSAKNYRIKVSDLEAWVKAMDVLNSSPDVKKASPDVNYNVSAAAQ